MLEENENKIIRLIKLAPAFIIFISAITTFIIIKSNNANFNQHIKEIEQETIQESKKQVKREVERVYDYIDFEKKRVKKEIKRNLKLRVYEAHSIAENIYLQNHGKSKEEIKKLIYDTLKPIRFNSSRGYYFILDSKHIVQMHPISNYLKGKNILRMKDAKGKHLLEEFNKIIEDKGEGFLTWWWTKSNDKINSYEKIGFIKRFEALDLFIVSGEYIKDYEDSLKVDILEKVKNIQFLNNGYIFIFNEDGTLLNHINPSLINSNMFDSKNQKRKETFENLLKSAKSKNQFYTYSTIKPSTGKFSQKTSYVKPFEEWNWIIGSGVYINEINNILSKKKKHLVKNNKNQLYQVLVISLILFTFLIALSIYFSKIIKQRFIKYKTDVKIKNDQLKLLNNTLESKVLLRTEELESINKQLQQTIQDLSKTKEDLSISQKMATLGELVSSITHEINTPLGISLTSISHIEELTKKTKKLFETDEMTEEEFISYLDNTIELSKIITFNLKSTGSLVKSFKTIALDQSFEEQREFFLKEYLEQILLALKSKTKKHNIEIKIVCDKSIVLNTYPNLIFQIITNLINNSILHGFSKNSKGTICIFIEEFDKIIKINYEDNGSGIPPHLINNIFDKYFTTKKGKGGTGLGLHIIQNIVNEHLQGKIEIDTSNKQGVRFVITIPKKIKSITIAKDKTWQS